MRRWVGNRIIVVLSAALVFGVVMSVIKGNGAGTRSDVGNLSAPWLLVPFLAAAIAARGRHIAAGVVIGTVASMAALVGFYVANSVVLDLGPHPWTRDLQLAIDGGQRWFELGLVSGPVLGAIGGLWSRTRSRALGVAVCALLVAEPAVEWLLQNHAVGFFAISGTSPGVWVGEALVGVAACAIAARVTANPSGALTVP
jgi:hypothetical protein